MTTNNKIDLNTCKLGQKLELRNGNIVEYERKRGCDCLYPHQVDGQEYTSDGRYYIDKESFYDIVNILPSEKPKPEIDLNTCVPGQRVKLRCGKVNYYTSPMADGFGGKYTHQINGDSYMHNGCYWSDYRESELDVVEILPLEKESKPVTDLRTCVPGQKLRLRYGAIDTYQRATDCAEYPHRLWSGRTYTDEGYYWLDKGESDNDVMEILPMEEEPVKTEPELTHSITDQIDVTSPDHVSIIPHEHGVTISIKKGLTTISWRHYNS